MFSHVASISSVLTRTMKQSSNHLHAAQSMRVAAREAFIWPRNVDVKRLNRRPHTPDDFAGQRDSLSSVTQPSSGSQMAQNV